MTIHRKSHICTLARAGRLAVTLVFSVVALALFSGAVAAQNRVADAAGALIAKLQRGGYNVYVRHAATDWSQSDTIASREDIASCDASRVRQLSASGREQARRTGEALAALGIRFGAVYSSPYCRAVETARAMTGKAPTTTDDMMNLRSASYAGGRETVVERARAALSKAPAESVNAFFAAHGNLGRAATGEYLGEGELLVLAPQGKSRFSVEGRLKLEQLEARSR